MLKVKDNFEDKIHSSTDVHQVGRNTSKTFFGLLFLGFLNSKERDNYSSMIHSNRDIHYIDRDTNRNSLDQLFLVFLILKVKNNSECRIHSSKDVHQVDRNTNKTSFGVFLEFLNSKGRDNYSSMIHSNIKIR